MKTGYSPGKLLRTAVEAERPLQVIGVPNAYTAVMAEKTGFLALYLSGAGVANSAFALPDLGMTTLSDVLEEVRRITGASLLPLLVDCDTGFGGRLMIGRTVREMIRAGAAGMHLEDQTPDKRCGHRPGKSLVPVEEMVDRIKAAVDARSDPDFVIMARTDAFAVEGMDAAVERACRYRDAGADMIFPEALTTPAQYRVFADKLRCADPGQPDRVRCHPPVYPPGDGRGRGEPGSLSALGFPGHERSGAQGLSLHQNGRQPDGGARFDADPVRTV